MDIEHQDWGRLDYATSFSRMQSLVDARIETRTSDKPLSDLLITVEHPSIYTLGIATKPEHLLSPRCSPTHQTDRGGQVTWHGPGQLVIYPILDLDRLGYGPRSLVQRSEKLLQALIDPHLPKDIPSFLDPKAPGVYASSTEHADRVKLASLGFKIRRGISYHGMSLNIDADLSAFDHINPCGYAGLSMANLCQFDPNVSFESLQQRLVLIAADYYASETFPINLKD